MGIVWNVTRVVIAAVIIVTVAEFSKRWPRGGALLLSLPVLSILAFLMGWFQYRDMASLSRLSQETLVLVPLGLPFFIPFALAGRLGLGFWSCFAAGSLLVTLSLGSWLLWGASSWENAG